MGRMVDMTGLVYGWLTVIRKSVCIGLKRPTVYWVCLCKCGVEFTANGQDIRAGKTSSCGCFRIAHTIAKSTTHGQDRTGNKTREYVTWTLMKRRCYNKNDKSFTDYGGRGIKVCDRWLGDNGFINFFGDMGVKPTKNHTLDRYPNVNGDYAPDTCRWATQSEQCRNKRNNRRLTYNGETKLMVEWANLLNTKSANITTLLKRRDFSKVVEYLKVKNGITF
jgi:hypothetical protein